MTPDSGSGDIKHNEVSKVSEEEGVPDAVEVVECPEVSISPETLPLDYAQCKQRTRLKNSSDEESVPEVSPINLKPSSYSPNRYRRSRERAPSPELYPECSPSSSACAESDGPSPKPDIIWAPVSDYQEEGTTNDYGPRIRTRSAASFRSGGSFRYEDFESDNDEVCPNRLLANIGNSCYMNATLQALVSCKPFLKCIQAYLLMLRRNEVYLRESNEQEFIDNCIFVLWKMSRRTWNTIDSSEKLKQLSSSTLVDLRSSFGKRHADFDNSNQHDAHEFLTLLLAIFDETMTKNNIQVDSGLKFCDEIRPASVFNFTTEECYQCTSCGHETFNEAHANHLSMNIRPMSSVQSLASSMFVCTTVEKKCSRENCRGQEARCGNRIVKFPQCLILHLQRYVYTNEAVRKKSFDVETSATLNISELSNFSEYYTMRPMDRTSSPSSSSSSSTPSSPYAVSLPEEYEQVFFDKNSSRKSEDKENGEVENGEPSTSNGRRSGLNGKESKNGKQYGFNPLRDKNSIKRYCENLNLEFHEDIIDSHLADFVPIDIALDRDTRPEKFGHIGSRHVNTFFRCISWWISSTEKFHKSIRETMQTYLALKSKPEEIDELLQYNMQHDIVDQLERFALATLLNVDLVIREDEQWNKYSPQRGDSSLFQKSEGAIYLSMDRNGDYTPIVSVSRRKRRLTSNNDDNQSGTCSPKRIKLAKRLGMTKVSDENVADGEAQYELVAAVCHAGYSPYYGHYVAFTREEETGNWFRCSDDCVRWISERRMMDTVCEEGYVLYYVRRET